MPNEKKTTLDDKIDFRTTSELKAAVEKAARGIDRTIGWVMNKLIIDYILEREEGPEQERRINDD